MWVDEDDAFGKDEEYWNARIAILQDAENAFVDTDEEFSSIARIKEKFEACKFQEEEAYKQAFCALSMPMLFSPFVRLELMKWQPLVDSSNTFDKMKWYQELFNYGVNEVLSCWQMKFLTFLRRHSFSQMMKTCSLFLT